MRRVFNMFSECSVVKYSVYYLQEIMYLNKEIEDFTLYGTNRLCRTFDKFINLNVSFKHFFVDPISIEFHLRT